MKDEAKPLKVDGDGNETLAHAVGEMLNQFGALYGREISYEELAQESGIAYSSDNGALVYSEQENILGGYTQECQYPFYIVYRLNSTAEWQNLAAAQFMDNIGKWICGEPVTINGEETALEHFPALSGNRVIKRIVRQNYYALEPNASGVQDWLLPVTVQYTNEIPPKW